MRFKITFHGPFLVATGSAERGRDVIADPLDLLPASSLKGAMRAAAVVLVGDHDIVDGVFGRPGTASAWAWTQASFAEPPEIAPRVRIRISEDTGTAARGALVVADQVWTSEAGFEVEQIRGLDADELARHESLLVCAGHAVHSLGGSRRRGLGWVGVTAVDPTLSEQHLGVLAELREAS